MEIKAQHRYARMSPRKLRLMRSIVRGLPVAEADAQLRFMPGKAPQIVLKVLRSAVANAKHNFEAEAVNLVVTDLIVDEGFVMKRFNPVSRGMAHPIHKKTAHVTVLLEERGVKTKKKRAAKKTQIEDITVDTHLEQASEHHDHEHDHDESKPATPEVAPKDKEMETFQKMKMQQMGGDKKKSNRRRSLKEGD